MQCPPPPTYVTPPGTHITHTSTCRSISLSIRHVWGKMPWKYNRHSYTFVEITTWSKYSCYGYRSIWHIYCWPDFSGLSIKISLAVLKSRLCPLLNSSRRHLAQHYKGIICLQTCGGYVVFSVVCLFPYYSSPRVFSDLIGRRVDTDYAWYIYRISSSLWHGTVKWEIWRDERRLIMNLIRVLALDVQHKPVTGIICAISWQ